MEPANSAADSENVKIFEESTTCTYLIDESFVAALKHLRMAVQAANLTIRGELDLAQRVRRKLMLNVPPCVVFFVSSPTWMQEELPADPYVAAVMPLHIVVSSRGLQTEVHFLRASLHLRGTMDRTWFATLKRLQALITQAIEKIGMRNLEA
jgi:uncharacterized protein (DUF302 family)